MDPVAIIIPSHNYEETKKYYCDILNFSWKDNVLIFPNGESDISLKIMCIDEESKLDCPPRENFPLFNYVISQNFLEYCNEIYPRGARFDALYATSNGYQAIIRDTSNNIFEIECHYFDGNNQFIDFLNFPFNSIKT